MTDHVFPIMLSVMKLINCIDTELLQFFNKNNAPPPLEIKTGDLHDL